MKTRTALALSAAILLTCFVWTSPPAKAGTMEEIKAVVTKFSDGLSQANSTQVQAVCTTPLWNRCAPAFSGSPAAGSLGTFQVASVGYEINVANYATALLICRHPDGVEDVVRVTLKKEGNAWKVAGGPTGVTSANPLR